MATIILLPLVIESFLQLSAVFILCNLKQNFKGFITCKGGVGAVNANEWSGIAFITQP